MAARALSALDIFGLGHLFVVKAFQWVEVSAVSPFSHGQLAGAVIVARAAYMICRETYPREHRARA